MTEFAARPPSTGSERLFFAGHAVLQAVEAVLEALALLALLSAMVIVSADALGRYLFNHPLSWVTESLTMYILPVIFFFGLGVSIAKRAHVVVDVLISRSPNWVKLLSGVLSSLLGATLFALILVVCLGRLTSAITTSEVNPGVIIWPVWPSFAVVCLGTLVATLRCTLNFCIELAALLGLAPAVQALLVPAHHEVFE